MRHRKKEKAFGPSPHNGYTAGSPKRRFWQRKPNRDNAYVEKNPDSLPTHATPADVRTSYATDATAVGGEPPINKYENTTAYGNASAVPTTYTGQQGGLVGSGHQTQTTTHVPHQHDGYVRNHQAYNQNPTGTF
jgi:hypothetical protein